MLFQGPKEIIENEYSYKHQLLQSPTNTIKRSAK
jgi:hypothetical protein